MIRTTITAIAFLAILAGQVQAQTQLGSSRPKIIRPVCEIVQDAAEISELAPKLAAAAEQCGTDFWVSVNLGRFSAADMAGLLCRPGMDVVVDGGKMGCVGGVWQVDRRVIRTK
ncbi:hypothetical protein ACIU1J_30085 [Azospirillum doebereinerae]|uniref:hypothetical protein n=1 Tax=Azospirillum doebereinerae TaxID=92933 RepID=UPI001EE50CFE|nr:hypothetical protein [Azospirillum doebereinerae]MCG5240940.1 hypothetical protein [Azospirillum doebereinerae]